MKKALSVILFLVLVSCGMQGVTLPTQSNNKIPVLGTPSVSARLTIDEYAVVPAAEDTPDYIDFMARIPPEVRDAHALEKYGNPETLVQTPNELLEPFGYRLQQNPMLSSYSFELYKDDALIVEGISSFHPVTVREDGSDFTLLMDLQNGDQLIAIAGTVGKRGGDEVLREAPVYAGNALIEAWYEGSGVVVTSDGEHVFSTPAEFMVDYPLKGLYAWQDHWVLEVDGEVFIDGENLNDVMDYAKIFGWHLVDGHPFYFFIDKQDGRTGVSYNGTVLEQEYDQVIHYACCEPAAFNPGFSERMVWFFALRDGMWYYVEMGVYE